LAASGVTFTKNHCPSQDRNPSRSAVIAGKYPSTSREYSNDQDWRKVMPDAFTLGHYLRKNGYFSAGAGKKNHDSQGDLKG